MNGTKVVIVTGCDANFYDYMRDAITSFTGFNLERRADFAVLDLGLTDDQVAQLGQMGCTVVKPHWTLSVPEVLKAEHQIGLVARTALREYFPGYDVYLWFDADAWAQTPEFFDQLVDGARTSGAAVICENGANYKMDLVYARWWWGNMITAYGIRRGIMAASKPVINIGIMAISNNAPHWDAWMKYYIEFVSRRAKVNNQHSFNAAVTVDRLDCRRVDARHNWITVLSTPSWNPETKLLCEPNRAAKPISVIHLAGPNKKRIYELKKTNGGVIKTALTYQAIKDLQAQ